jgi:CRISPR/Cas system-associated exonuclease Cas4 (RecB family)
MDIQHHISPQPTVEAIKAWWKTRGDSETKRHYLGGSAIGSHCERALWYGFRHMTEEDFDGRMYRLFHRGHNEEITFVKELRAVGVEVHEVDANGAQFAVSAVGGHFGGHMDGVAKGLLEAREKWHVLEFKTHSAKSFADVKAKGVREAKPQHFDQMQVYMKLSKLDRAYYLAVNKDTDELYSERIRYDAAEGDRIMAKAERIITSQNPPDRPYSRSDYYLCKWCPAQKLCWSDTKTSTEPAVPVPLLSCRQCMHATPELDGEARWSCAKHKKDLTFTEQCNPCESMLFIPSLIEFAQPKDAIKDDKGNDVIVYEGEGSPWMHGPNAFSNQYSCRDLSTLPESLIGCTGMSAAKMLLGAEGATVISDIHMRYHGTSQLTVWRGKQVDLTAALTKELGSMTAPTLTAKCDEWNAAEWVFDGESRADIAAFIYPGGMSEIVANVPF